MEIKKVCTLATEEKDTLISAGKLARTIITSLEAGDFDVLSAEDIALFQALSDITTVIIGKHND